MVEDRKIQTRTDFSEYIDIFFTQSYKKAGIKGKMPGILGFKLRRLRENAGLSQQDLANAVNLSSEYISLLELARRTPSLATLTILAEFFKKEITYFLEEKEIEFQALFQDKKINKKTKAELKKFQKFCQGYLELEDLAGRHLEPAPIYSSISPERLAYEERQRLGLGDAPVPDIFSVLESNGLRIMLYPLSEDARISGIFIYLEDEEAAFALINNAQSYEDQVTSAAHVYCHYLRDRCSGPIVDNTDVLVEEYLELYHPREKFAQSFASHFLIPRSTLKTIVEKEFCTNRLEFEDVLYIRRYFQVSLRGILRALKEMNCLSDGQFKKFQKLKPDNQEDLFFGMSLHDQRIKKIKKPKAYFSDRLLILALAAYRKKKINAEKLSVLLGKEGKSLIAVLKNKDIEKISP